MNYFRQCFKCKKEFNEKELEISHDFPKYLGGTDKDGRHLLCKKCHQDYELKIFIFVTSYLKSISLKHKKEIEEIIKKVKKEFFNDGGI